MIFLKLTCHLLFRRHLKIQLIVFVTHKILDPYWQEYSCIYKSFIPSSIREWNELPFECRKVILLQLPNISSIRIFQTSLITTHMDLETYKYNILDWELNVAH